MTIEVRWWSSGVVGERRGSRRVSDICKKCATFFVRPTIS